MNNPLDEFTTLQAIVDQLRACAFTCEAGRLESNVAFMALEKLAKEPSFVNVNQEAFLKILSETGSFEIKTEVTATSTIKPLA